MNREIKFRIWDNLYNCFMPENVYAIINQNQYGAFAIMILDWNDYRIGEYSYAPQQQLMQFTGLKDKNGKEIYEGDLVSSDKGVKFRCYFSQERAQFVFVQDTKFGGKYVYKSPRWIVKNCEVVGNIYQNQELLR